MFDLEDEDRIRRTELRLNQIERLLQELKLRPPSEDSPPKPSAPTPTTAALRPPPLPEGQQAGRKPASVSQTTMATQKQGGAEETITSATAFLGWAGAAALTLAAVYLIRLAIDSGWLTPIRQIGLAVLGAFGLILSGLALRHSNRQYAGLLPSAGIVILFLSVYGAHLYYHFIDVAAASALIILVCLLALWLGKVFESNLYLLFAVAGSYSAPFLLPSFRNNITDLVIYFTAWSFVFCIYSVWIGNRMAYLLALYFALISFDFIWKTTASTEWVAALVFQFVQFVLFAGCAAIYSIKQREPMSTSTAWVHLPALLIFYIVQYALLKQHTPAYAPWIALASMGFLAGCYLIARAYLREVPQAGKLLLSAYAALVLFHAGYLESVPAEWAPWVAFLLLPAIAVYAFIQRSNVSIEWPLVLAIGLIFTLNYFRLVMNMNLEAVPGKNLLVILYAVELYLAYYFIDSASSMADLKVPLLFAGHINAMAAALHIFDNRFAVSLTWGLVALSCLMISISVKDKVLGKSSLFVFAASAIKTFLYDLSGAVPVVRIISLLILGVTFYLGGWLYQKVSTL